MAFRTEPDVISIVLAAQSAILAAEWIPEIGWHHYDVVELIGFLKVEIEAEKNRAKSAIADLAIATKRAEDERAKVMAEEEKSKHIDLQQRAAEERANAVDAALTSARAELKQLKADLEAEKKVAKEAQSAVAKAFNAGEMAAMKKYADETLNLKIEGSSRAG